MFSSESNYVSFSNNMDDIFP